MKTFAYRAINSQGLEILGTLSAGDRASALLAVEGLGLAPVALDDVVPAGERGASLWSRGRSDATTIRLKPAVTLVFMRQLASLLAAGVSLSRALQILGRESSRPEAQRVWKGIHDRVVDGESLADAFGRFPRTFTSVAVAMVRAGEAGGFLDVVLKQIADFMERERELKSRVGAALVYPLVLAVIATAVVVFLLSWFIPRFSEIFTEFGESLPLLTQIIQAASLAVRDYGLFVALGIGLVVFALRRYVQTPAGRRSRDRLLPKLPGIGNVTTRFGLVRFTRMLGTLIGAGVPLLAALGVARQAVGNQVLSDALARAIDSVSTGVPLARSLGQCPELFPETLVEMISVAEESGRLDAELVRMAAELESDLDRQLRVLVALAEPALLFVMATVVGTIVIGMLLPVFDLWDAVK